MKTKSESLRQKRGHEPARKDGLQRLLVLTSTYPRWINDPEPGFVHELSRRLVDRFDVTVLCPHAYGAAHEDVLDGVRILRYSYAPSGLETLVNDGGIVTNLRRHPWKWILVPGFFLGQWLALRRVMRQWRPDVIHAHWLLPQGIVATTVEGSPFVVTSHGADLFAINGRLYAWLRAYVLGRAAAVTVVSKAMRDRLHLESPDTEARVMPMGVDFGGLFKPDLAKERSRATVLFVGRLVSKKGVVHLIDAMPTVLEKHVNARLDIVGFGPEREALLARVKSLGIEAHVRFVGAVPQMDLPRYYQESAVCVAPFVQDAGGDQEGLGLVVAEAIACLCPVVVGDVPAVHDLLRGHHASIVPQRDVKALARAIVDILDDPVNAQRRVLKMRESLGENFSWRAVADGYAKLLNSLTQQCEVSDE
jgi:glycosyltransferase involved in cell wall biosynthesis